MMECAPFMNRIREEEEGGKIWVGKKQKQIKTGGK